MPPLRRVGFYAPLKQKQEDREKALFLSRRARRKGLNRSLEIFIPKPTLGLLGRGAKEFRHTKAITAAPRVTAVAAASPHAKASTGGAVRPAVNRKKSYVVVDFWLDQNQMLYSRRYDELTFG